jgi:hypothetical protein
VFVECLWGYLKIVQSINLNTTKLQTLVVTRMPEEEKKQLITSLRVDSTLWKEAKIQAVKHDITLAELVEEAINLWIQEKMPPTEQNKK